MTGCVNKKKSHIHRLTLQDDYYLIQLHETEFQISIRTNNNFKKFDFFLYLLIVSRITAQFIRIIRI